MYQSDASRILPLLGTEVRVLHPPDEAERSSRGGDLDCAVRDLDPTWPLRLNGAWRLVQCIWYDVTGWFWVLEREGHILEIDTLDDPEGIGNYGFPTVLALTASDDDAPAIRAAYLVLKRLRKGIRTQPEWEHIRILSRSSPDVFRRSLQTVLGNDVAAELLAATEQGRAPEEALSRRAMRRVLLRRIRHPSRAALLAAKSALRLIERILHPTGLTVVLAGPDGTGKSTLADALPHACKGPFRRTVRMHWRPGVLPRLGSIVGAPAGDPTDPHGRSPHSESASRAALVYYWLDFLIGGWLLVLPARIRSSLVITERGWWDMGVDPRRYRLRVSERIVSILGRLLATPDLVLVLEAPIDELAFRKPEISGDEALRQMDAWRRIVPREVPRVYLDASGSGEDVVAAAREAIFQTVSTRALGRLGFGWTSLPSRASARWILPRGPRRVAAAAPAIYQPVTLKGRAGWELARLGARIGAFRLLPRSDPPPPAVRRAMAPHLSERETLATMNANHPGRYVVAVITQDGRVSAIAKVATDRSGQQQLRTEAAALRRLAPLLPPGVGASEVLLEEEGLLLLQAIASRPRARPWILPIDIAFACGTLFARTANAGSPRGAAHGDLAPWNVLRTSAGWALVDWEDARDDAPAFFDVFHYVVQAHTLLGRPSSDDIMRGLSTGAGWVGAALRAYASAAGLPASAAVGFFPEYLEATLAGLDPRRSDGRRGIEARRSLLARTGVGRSGSESNSA